MKNTFLLSLCLAGALPAQAIPTAALDELLRSLATERAPGCVIAVGRAGRVAWLGAAGVTDVETGTPIRADTPFYVASVSKQFTAAAVALLAQDGKLALDDDVRRHVSGLPDYGATITLRHLIEHRSGLRDYFELWMMAGRDPEELTAPEPVLALVRRQEHLCFSPGSDFIYSNTGYLLLAEVVRKASGQSLRVFAQARVFGPLGMSASAFRDDPAQVVAGAAVGHDRVGGALRPVRTRFALVGSGGLWSTAADQLKWLHNFAAPAVGDAAFVQRLQTPGDLPPAAGCDPRLGAYASGLMLGNHRGRPTIGHSGGSFGFRARTVRYPRDDLAIVCLANGPGVDPDAVARRVAELCLPEAATHEPPSGAASAPASVPAGTGIRFYRSAGGEVAALRRTGNAARLALLSWQVPLRPVAADRFIARDTALPTTCAVERDKDGAERLVVTVGTQTPRTYDALPDARPDEAEVSALAGTWRSAELDASIELVVRDGRLRLAKELRQPVGPMLGVTRDLFVADSGFQLDVVRDADGRVTGLLLSSGRVRGVSFARS